jgi:hypothetical protein
MPPLLPGFHSRLVGDLHFQSERAPEVVDHTPNHSIHLDGVAEQFRE